MQRALIALTATVLTVPAFATLTVNDGDAQMQMVGGLFTKIFDSNLGDATFRTDAGDVDQMYKYTWYYRTPNNNQNRYFSYFDSPSTTETGNTATATYTNAGPGPSGVERFNADFNFDLADGAPGAAGMDTTVVITNPNSAPVTYNFFVLIDMDLRGTVTDDTASQLSPEPRFRFDDGGTGTYGEAVGLGATRYEVGSGSTLRNKLNGGSADLSNTMAAGPGDLAAAFQWTVTLAPQESTTLVAGFAINQAAIPEPATLLLLGLGVLALRRR